MIKQFKILIVEDEHIERKGIEYLLRKYFSGLFKFFEAVSGLEAIKIFKEEKPEIVLMDIKIPDTDGLSTAKKMKAIYSDTAVIIITGFNEFDFAKKAIQLGAFDYLLKPLDPNKFYNVINRLIKKIKKDKKEKEKNEELKKRFNENFLFLKQAFIRNIILGYEFEKDKILKKAELFSLKAENYCLFAFKFSESELETIADNEKKKIFLKLNILKVVEGYLKNYKVSMCYEILENFFIILIGNIALNKEHFNIKNECIKIAKRIQLKLNSEIGLNVDFGISNHCHNITQIDCLFDEIKKALDYRKCSGNNSISHITEIMGYEKETSVFPVELENCLIKCFEQGEIEDIRDVKTKIMQYFVEHNETLIVIKQKLLEFMFLIFRNIKYEDENNFVLKILYDYFIKIVNTSNIQEMGKSFEGYLIDLNDRVLKVSGERYKSIVEQTKDYIKENISLKLNLKMVAEKFYLSPSYFSSLFKKELGINFNEYLVNTRIESSKYLLKNVKKNIVEVSKLVGFKNASYFSYIFKKKIGVSPNDYRLKNFSIN